MATMKDIAKLAGVSRGTVDRVLNHRGAVHAETEQKVRAIAKALNYTPNKVGKSLAVRKKQLKFGYILFGSTISNPFFDDVVTGIERRTAELDEYGVTVEIRYTSIDSPEEQVQHIDELVSLGIAGLVIVPINHALVTKKLQKVARKGIPVVTANSDLPDCGRIAYVGSDYFKSGETAAGLMNLITGGKANIGIVVGSPLLLCHSERISGFTEYSQAHFPGLKVVAKALNNDDDLDSYMVTMDMLASHPEIDALFLAAAGVYGACRGIKDGGLAGKLKVVSYDASKSTAKLIQQGVISATICQQPFYQGAKPLDILLEHLGMGVKPSREFYYTDLEIKIRENL